MSTSLVRSSPSTSTLTLSQLLAEGERHFVQRRLPDAERCFSHAAALDPTNAQMHFRLGRVKLLQGDDESALQSFRTAVELDESLTPARRYLMVSLVRTGRRGEATALLRHESASQDGRNWFRDLTTAALGSRNLWLAGEYARIAAELRWGQPVLQRCAATPLPDIPNIPLSAPKLRHDGEQLAYLRRKRLIGPQFDQHVDRYRRLAETLVAHGGPDARAALDWQEYEPIRGVYNRLVYLRPTDRVARALSNSWNAADVEGQYIERQPGITVIDNFLTAEALQELRNFCLESTVWFHNRYAYGRLGAFFQDGFNCPLLLQISEELRARLTRVIGDRYPLRQLWGFKNTQPLPADVTTHADFAAVNVNLWITSEDANLDEHSGGLVLYDVDAPMNWDFDTYNGSDSITPYLRRQRSKAVTIPYRHNRAIVFNSDLFHGTDAVSFRSEYQHHRTNVTMLYGNREEDAHHRHLARSPESASLSSWNSPPLRRLRKAP